MIKDIARINDERTKNDKVGYLNEKFAEIDVMRVTDCNRKK